VRLIKSAGNEHDVRPDDAVGTIAYHADTPGKSLGAIVIEPCSTSVDVQKGFVGRVLEHADRYEIHREQVNVALAG